MYRLISYSQTTETFIKMEVEKKTFFGIRKKTFDFVLINGECNSSLKYWVDINTGKYANSLGLGRILSACLSKENIEDNGFLSQTGLSYFV